MFPDIAGTELILVAIVALLVVKPKDLPIMMRRFGEFMNKARRMAADFRASFDDMARQSELDDLRKEVEAMRSKASDPMGLNTALSEVQSDISQSLGDHSLGDPNSDYGYSHTDDNSVPWDPSAMPSEEETVVAAKPKRKTAPRKPATSATPKPAATETVAGKSAKAKPAVEAAAKPKRPSAKKAV